MQIHTLISRLIVLNGITILFHLSVAAGDRRQLHFGSSDGVRTADVFLATTRKRDDAEAKPMFSINGKVYLVMALNEGDQTKPKSDAIIQSAFGRSRWDLGRYIDGIEGSRTHTYSKQAGKWTQDVSDSGKFLGYSLAGPSKDVRLVTQTETGTSHEWLKETKHMDASGADFLLRAADGEFQGWYLSFGEPKEIKEKTKWKDSDGKSREMPPHIRYPALLVKEPDDRSLLREVGYYPEGK